MFNNNFLIFLGEFSGTFILVFIGCGIVGLNLLEITTLSLAQIAAVWGTGVTMAIYATKNLSGAHLNPAVTITLAVWRKSERSFSAISTYLFSQLSGAFTAAVLLFLIFGQKLAVLERSLGVIRGETGSEASAKMFGEYFGNIGIFKAFAAEFIGGAILVLVIFVLSTDWRYKFINPVLIGLTIVILIYFLAPFTQAGLNPARDFGPRLVSFMAGWRQIAIPGPDFGFTVYILGPVFGGLFGGGLYQLFGLSRRLLKT